MKELAKKIYNKLSVIVAVVCFFIMACEAEDDRGIVIQLVAVAVFVLVCLVNRKKWFNA